MIEDAEFVKCPLLMSFLLRGKMKKKNWLLNGEPGVPTYMVLRNINNYAYDSYTLEPFFCL